MHTFIHIFTFACMMMVNIANAKSVPEQIVGRWISEKGDFMVDVYKTGNKYSARLVWYDDHDIKANIEDVIDDNNPNPALKNRKVLGIEVLRNLTYNPKNNQYEDGVIYDATTGKEWNAYVYINEKGGIVVKGYWHFKFISQSLSMKRYDDGSKINIPAITKNSRDFTASKL